MTQGRRQVSPEVAGQLVDLVRQLRPLVYGGDGVPEWGTTLPDAPNVIGLLSSVAERRSYIGESLRHWLDHKISL